MRTRFAMFACLLSAALLAGCAASPPETPAPDSTPKTEAPNDAVAAPAPVVPVTPVPVAPEASPAPAPSLPATKPDERLVDRAPGVDPRAPNRSCKTDADCAVKDVGNCCGRYPMCVNKNAKTDPAAVQAQCAKDGMASICGFEDVTACQCVQGQCQNAGSGAVVM